MTRGLLVTTRMFVGLAVPLMALDVGSGCSDEGTKDAVTQNVDAAAGADDDLTAALLTEEDLGGWTAHHDVPWERPHGKEGCEVSLEGLDALEGGLHIEFSPGGRASDVRVVQDVMRFADEEAANAFLTSAASVREACPSISTDDGDAFVVDMVTLDLEEAGLGPHAVGWHAEYDPAVVEFLGYSGIDAIGFQRGNLVSNISVVISDATELDALGLASIVHDRMGG